MTLSVIGAGFGRTGTLSLKLALERLGLGPCYHMKEVFAHPDHVPAWEQAADGGTVDWDALFEGYRSAVDFPASSFYGELAAHYPAAKVILTVRDPDRWFASVDATILRPLRQTLPAHLADWGRMARKTILERVFAGDASDRAHLVACYERHNAEVKRTIPAERLLVYEASQGWEPLCAFLAVPVPDEPFPLVNTTAEFQERIAPMLGV